MHFFRVCPSLFNQLLLGWALGLPVEVVAWVSSRLFCLNFFDCGCLNFCRVCPRLFNQLLLGWARGLPFELVACVSSRLGCLDFGCAQVWRDSSPDGSLDLFSKSLFDLLLGLVALFVQYGCLNFLLVWLLELWGNIFTWTLWLL